jgi:hypothetical protein
MSLVRRVVVPALLLVAPLLAARAGDDAPPPPAGGESARPAQPAIDAAVRRGVAWLRDEQKRDGSFGQGPGETGLSLLALRHSGVPADDRACLRAARYLERELPDGTVYGAALGVLALIAQDEDLHGSKIEELTGDLVRAQCENGQWTYAYRATAAKKSGDNSNSQFAMLALAVARQRGVAVAAEPFERAATFLRETQNEDGGYGYSDKERSRSYASMTAGGAMSLALAASVAADEPLGGEAAQADPSARRALEWLAEHFDAEKNSGAARAFGGKKGKRSDAFWRHYWLWSMERAAAASSVDRLGKHDWYGAGCRVLLDRQLDDGQWRDPEREILATCFALLFFRRSTHQAITPRDRPAPAITPGGGPR